MKGIKKLLSTLLSFSMLLPALCSKANALQVVGVKWNEDWFDPEIIKLEIIGKNEEAEWVNVYDDQGNPQYVEICSEDGKLVWEHIHNIPSDKSQAERLKMKKADLERKFGIKIVMGVYAERPYAVQLNLLYDLEQRINDIPAPLWTAVRNRLTSQGRILTVRFAVEKVDPNTPVILGWSLDGTYTDSATRIDLYTTDDSYIFAHEYGHMLHALLKKQYGAGNLKSNWIAYNGGLQYDSSYTEGEDNPVFVTGYASTSYSEDFAETFSCIIGDSGILGVAEDLAEAYPNSMAVKKLCYMRQLVCDAFKLEKTAFHPFQESDFIASQSKSGFADVSDNGFYSTPVRWAVENGITSGTSKFTFSPNQKCSVGEILTFLWRFEGSPKPTCENPFTYNRSNYFYDAALWAYEQELISPKTFFSSAPCTRGMTMVYMWKLAGEPKANHSEFSDIPSGSDVAKAVDWAVEKGIASGTGSHLFSPDATCTRGQIVTFLFRANEVPV